jgi:hypothetical protein
LSGRHNGLFCRTPSLGRESKDEKAEFDCDAHRRDLYRRKLHRFPDHRTESRPGAARQQQIACTVLGCQTIPAACYPKEEHSPTGIPTGFDQIVCPPGVWPF